METIEEVRKAKDAYIQEQVEDIINDVRKSKDFSASRSTCDAFYYGWDSKLYKFMPEIATKLREQGFGVTSKVNHGVTDWTIVLK